MQLYRSTYKPWVCESSSTYSQHLFFALQFARMCFTPLISAATAATEFSITGYIVKKDTRKKLLPLAVFVATLGAYQFTEFFLCMTSNDDFWARLGFVAYTFLPAELLHAFTNISGRKFWKTWYVVPVFFAGTALAQADFLVSSGCNLISATVQHAAFNNDTSMFDAYLFYYTIYPLIGLFLYVQALKEEPQKKSVRLSLKIALMCAPLAVLFTQIYFLSALLFRLEPIQVWLQISLLVWVGITILVCLGSIHAIRTLRTFQWVLGVIMLSSLSTSWILYEVYPHFSYEFPSIYCHFAILYGVAAVYITKYEYRDTAPVQAA